MFTLIIAKNFKSLDNIEINFCKNKSTVNNFVAIYGENGAGKTNIVELFDFLTKTITARTYEVKLATVLNQELADIDIDLTEFYKKAFNVKPDYKEYRTIDEKGVTEISYCFEFNERKYKYEISFNDRVIKEELYFAKLKSNSYTNIFKIWNNGILNSDINVKCFINNKYNNELIEEIRKYWGKYTFLSILTLENVEKNIEYVKENVGQELYDAMDYMISTIVQVKESKNNMFPYVNFKENNLLNLERVVINPKKEDILKKYEEVLRIFFTEAYSDIKDVVYLVKKENEETSYELNFKKVIGGKLRTIPVSAESSGTRRIVQQFNKFLMALDGKTVVIDEIDDGIHDLLMKNIITSLKEEITGQMIITTHNTLLLEELPKESIYLIVVDRDGKKSINSLKDYNYRIQKNNNTRNLYLKGMFGGIPLSEYIDFEAIKEVMKDKE